MTKKILRSSLILIALSLTTACASAALGDEDLLQERQAKMAAQQKSVYKKMSSLIGRARCDVDAQCASMPVGNSECGGPANYLVYSTMIGDNAINELTTLSNETKELDIEMAKLQESGIGMMGICRYNTPSDVACIENVCKAIASDVLN